MVIADNRNERLDGADGSMSGLLWFVLIVGAGVTLGYPAFFGASNLLPQTLMTTALAAHVALSLLLAIAFDYPFTGSVFKRRQGGGGLRPRPLGDVLD